MNVLLINPSQTQVYGELKTPDFPPMGLAYLGAVLDGKGHAVNIIDMDADHISEDALAGLLREHAYDLVGLTTTTPTLTALPRCAIW